MRLWLSETRLLLNGLRVPGSRYIETPVRAITDRYNVGRAPGENCVLVRVGAGWEGHEKSWRPVLGSASRAAFMAG